MTRTTAREIAVQLIYSAALSGQTPGEAMEEFFEEEHYSSLSGEGGLYDQLPDKKQMEYIGRLVGTCCDHRIELDRYIEKYARGWKPERITKTAAAVLRCAMCEILYMDDVPDSAAINEAVELAKGYDEPETVSFINGVLGSFIRGEKGGEAPETVTEPEEAPKPEPVSEPEPEE